MIPIETVYIAKLIVAVIGAAVLLFGRWPDQSPPNGTAGRLAPAALTAAGLAAALLWIGPTALRSFDPNEKPAFSVARYLHLHDLYHYVMGARYFTELGYTGLYEAAVIASYDNGHEYESMHMVIRSSRTKEKIRAAAVIADRQRYTSRFTKDRWQMFRKDIDHFRTLAFYKSPTAWQQMNADHGFNPSPVWCLAGALFSNAGGTLSNTLLLGFTLLDLLLVVGTGVAIGWAFGWRTVCVCLIFAGTNHTADLGWTSPSLLRFDWLFLLILGICLLKRQHAFFAGACVAYAALIRVFPALMLLGVLIKEMSAMVLDRNRLSTASLRLLAGGLTAAAIIVPLSTASSGRGWPVWQEFYTNAKTLVSHPASNYVGLKTLLWVQPRGTTPPHGDDAGGALTDAYVRIVWHPAIVVALISGLYAVLLFRFARGIPAWRASILGLAFIPILGDLSCYYYVFLIAYGLLSADNPKAGAALCALSAATLILYLSTTFTKVYYWTSFYVVLFVLAVALMERTRKRRTRH